MQHRPGHTETLLRKCATARAAWPTERKLQAIPFSSFPSHCHPIFSCSSSTVYTASISLRACLGNVVYFLFLKLLRPLLSDLQTTFVHVAVVYSTHIYTSVHFFHLGSTEAEITLHPYCPKTTFPMMLSVMLVI